ncbi:MAG: M56 family metallopeptidase, partial [Planctomycetaceae bacterium]
MFAAFPAFAIPAGDLTVLFLDVVVKATVLLILAAAADALLRRGSAAARHRVWCLAFCGLLGLPALTMVLPSWRLAILPAPSADTADEVASVAAATSNTADEESASETLDADDDPPAFNVFEPMRSEHRELLWGNQPQPLAAGDAAELGHTTQQPTAFSPASPPPQPDEVSEAKAAAPWSVILTAMWLIGAAVTAVPLAIGFVRNGTLRRAAHSVEDVARTDLVATLSSALGLRRRVRLLETGRAIVPMTWGVLRPIVLFPVAWQDWTSQRRQLVLLHELAHVKRCDVAFQLIARLSCAVYWFHPLAWYALRRLRIERELACDDCVLMTGARPSEYAQELLEIARTYQSLALPTTVAMARPTNLEQRIRALLDRARPHLPLSRTSARLLLIGAVILITGVAAVRPSTRNAVAEPDRATSTANDDADSAIDETTTATAPQTENTPVSREASPSATGNAAKPEAVAESPADELTFHYRGRVLNPEGQPVAGARLYFVYWVHGTQPNQNVEPLSVTDADGWFDFTATRADIGAGADSYYAGSFSFPLVAIAEGYGFAEQSSLVFETTGQAVERLSPQARQWYDQQFKDAEPVLRLVNDDVPVRGRVVNTEGQPVAGARVTADNFWYNDEGTLDAWEAAAKEDKADFYSLRQHTPHTTNGPQMQSVIPDVTTGADGRFTLRGIGRERVAQLLISGPGIETNQVKTRTRDGETIEVPNSWDRDRDPDNQEIYHSAEFTHVAAPSVPVVGQVTDADTGEPIEGVDVSAGQQQTFIGTGKRWIHADTDKDGRYRLEGLPLENEEYLYVLPPFETAYLPVGRSVTTHLGDTAVERDFQLKQGIIVRGRAVDDRTGQPLVGPINYFVDAANPSLEDYPQETLRRVGHERRSDADGNFTIPVLPGRGVLTFTPDNHGSYRRGLGASTLTMKAEKAGGEFYRTHPSFLTPSSHRVLQEINPTVDSEPLQITLAPTSGETLTGRVLGPDGEIITDGRIIVDDDALQPTYYDPRQRKFHIEGYYPDQPREIYGFHIERNLAGHLRVEGDPPQNLTITLKPAASIRGRLVDDAGAPLSGVQLSGDGIPRDRYGYTDLRFVTDDDGRFHIRGLIPGRKYTIEARGDRLYGRILIDESVDTPETKDVGNVTTQPAGRQRVFPSPTATSIKPISREASPSATGDAAKPQAAVDVSESKSLRLRGRVTGPDGQPVPNAQVCVQRRSVNESEWLPLAQSSREGWWSAASEHTRFDAAFTENPSATVRLAATADGFGFAWTDVKVAALEENINLKLVNDLPIEGRFVTVDGQPAGDVVLNIEYVFGNKPADVDQQIENTRLGRRDDGAGPPGALLGEFPGFDPIITDREGRFRLTGIGAERVLRVTYAGEGLWSGRIRVVTRPMDEREAPSGVLAAQELPSSSMYAATFTHVAPPGRTIRGQVSDAETGKPVSGAQMMTAFGNRRFPKTDDQGRFELSGVLKMKEYSLDVVPFNSPHLSQRLMVDDPNGLQPLEIDIKLKRGIAVRGRVTDADTGQPIEGTVEYHPLAPNESAASLDDSFSIYSASSADIREDGTYELGVLPGPGVISVMNFGKGYVSAAVNAQQLRELVGEQDYAQGNDADIRFLHVSIGGQGRTAFGL